MAAPAAPAAPPAPPPVPAPPPAPTNYLQINAIRRQIAALNSKTSESHMYGIWDAILNWQFPVTDEYITRPQDLHRQFGGKKGFSDFHTFQYDAAGKERYFLITQCKPYADEGNEVVWRTASAQLIYYLNMQHKKRPAGSVYGIVAIGKRVRFYRYNYVQKKIDEWRPGPAGLPLLPGTPIPHGAARRRRDFYLMVEEVDSVQDALDWIRDRH